MRIAIDARAASHPQPGGFKTYTRNLIIHLARIDRVNEYIIYLDRPCAAGTLPAQENFAYRVLPNLVPFAGMVIREQVLLPLQLRRDAPDLVHFPCSTAPLTAACPAVVTIHDMLSHTELMAWEGVGLRERIKRRGMRLYHQWSERGIAHRAMAILTDSQASREKIARHYHIAPDLIKVVPLAAGIRGDAFDPQSARNNLSRRFALSEPFILGIVSASPRKNATGLIEAYACLDAPLIRRFALVLIWTHGLLQNHITQVARAHNLAQRVHFFQDVSDDELLAFYRAAQVFVFPSLEEGFGLPPLEALACGTPVVASNRSSIPEVVGDAALLVDPTRPDEIARALRRILTEPGLQAELSERGLRRAAQFSWERTARETLAVYENCVTGKRIK